MARLLFLAVVALSVIGDRTLAAETAPRPNILFIIFDDMNWNTPSAYGCKWTNTPNIDRVAYEGIRFTRAFTSNPKCSPCRASILTGRNTWQLEDAVCHNSIFPAKFVPYPDMLEKAGYSVGLTGKGWGPGDFRSTGFKRNPAGPLHDALKMEVPANGISRLDYAGNFGSFLKSRPADKPFCFWMGFHEPHRAYEQGSGVRLGKQLADVRVPRFLPDTPTVRGDLLDYAIEVEWGDKHIGRALKMLEDAGELDNTLIVVTSDHGMPFPYVKGQIFEDGFHLPLAMRWGKVIKPGRVVDDFVNVRDFAPTYLELAGAPIHPQITGKNLVDVLRSDKSGQIDASRTVMLTGKERHDLGRPNDWGYPARAVRTPEFLYVHNYFPDRWPAGNPETDYPNCDNGPTKDVVKALGGYFLELSFGKRPADALFRITDDPECVRNLANDPAFEPVMLNLKGRLLTMLKAEQDPRALGNGAYFDTIKYVAGRQKSYDTWLKAQGQKLAETDIKGKPKAKKGEGEK